MKRVPMKRTLMAASTTACLCFAAIAQEGEKSAALKAGDKAPALQVEKWVKGDPVSSFEKGKVYVVEFWATWCGPCIASMPHLSAMQTANKGKLTVIGVNIWEDARGTPYDDKTFDKVREFITEQGERVKYTVAYDGKSAATNKAYMQAAGLRGIPSAFLVDQSGTIAWIGNPMWLDIPLELVLADKWDPKTGNEVVQKAQDRFKEVLERAESSPKDAVAMWEGFEREYPASAKHMTDMKLNVLFRAGQYEQAYKLAGEIVDKAIAEKNATALNQIAWTIVDPEGDIATKDLDLAMKAATKADELTKHEDPAIIDTVARVYFLKGDIDKAIELQTKAISLAKGEMKAQLEPALKEYQAKKK